MKVLDIPLRGPQIKRAVSILAAAAVLIAAAILLKSSFSGSIPGKTEEQRLAYLQSLGWEAYEGCAGEKTILLPKEFPEVLLNYNQLQLPQGFDLTKYAGREVKMYTYELCNYPGERQPECSLYVYRGRIIGGDIHSNAVNGFMLPLVQKQNG